MTVAQPDFVLGAARLPPLFPFVSLPPPFISPSFHTFPLPFPFPGALPLKSSSSVWGRAVSSPSESTCSPAAKQFLVHFEVKIAPLLTFTLNSFGSRERLEWAGQLLCVAAPVLARLMARCYFPWIFTERWSTFSLFSVKIHGTLKCIFANFREDSRKIDIT